MEELDQARQSLQIATNVQAWVEHKNNLFSIHCAKAGAASHVAASGLREARVGETAAVVAEKGKEYGTKGWNFLKGVYGTVANQVEHVARDSGYKLDLGELIRCIISL